MEGARPRAPWPPRRRRGRLAFPTTNPPPFSARAQPNVFDASAPYARSYEMQQAAERPRMEREWREAHAALAKQRAPTAA